MSPDFSSFLDDIEWSSFDDHLEEGQIPLRREIEENYARECDIRERLRHYILTEKKGNLRTVDAQMFADARKELTSHVTGVDGTLAKVELLSGVRSQLGIVAVNYSNDKATYVTYVSEATFSDYDATDDILEVLQKRRKEERAVSDLVLRATLAYNERSRALEQTTKWRIVHGELFPFELRSGLGKLKALPTSLELFRNLINEKTIGSVVSDTSAVEINLGYALKQNEYFMISTLKSDYSDWLPDAHFSAEDEALFKQFIDDTAGEIYKGVYRVAQRPHVFYAHREVFDEFASILVADSSLIPERGFPMLIDYADTIAAALFRARDFENRVQYEIALKGDLLAEQSERTGRQH
jgi:hypothetical protein